MSNALIRKLDHAGGLTDADRVILLRACASPRLVAASQDLTCDGDRPENVHLILRGFAYRYKILPGGKRQITAVFIPGDFCDLHVAILHRMDHSIATLLPCEVVYLSRATIVDLTAGYPRIARALWWATLVDEAILRAWLVNMGQREASRQIAHLFCELHARLDAVGLAIHDEAGTAFDMPLRQTDIADMLGMTAVHVNRMLQELREAELIALKHRRLQIPDLARLQAFCSFDPAYLHLEDGQD
jgi:CRP-like cAMP-binding protein